MHKAAKYAIQFFPQKTKGRNDAHLAKVRNMHTTTRLATNRCQKYHRQNGKRGARIIFTPVCPGGLGERRGNIGKWGTVICKVKVKHAKAS